MAVGTLNFFEKLWTIGKWIVQKAEGVQSNKKRRKTAKTPSKKDLTVLVRYGKIFHTLANKHINP